MSIKKTNCRIAIGQILCVDGDIAGNLVRIERATIQAKKSQAEIVCLPEMALRGWVNPEAHDLASPIPGEDSDAICKLAQKHQIHISIGLAEKADNELFDSAILVNDVGEIILVHRKINILTELMEPSYAPGLGVSTVQTRFGKIGMLICADTFDQAVLEKMESQKPDLLLVPFGWANKAETWPTHGLSLQKTVAAAAKKIGCPVIGTNLVGAITHGPWQRRIYGGQSYAVDADGATIGRGADRDTDIILVDVQLDRR